MSTEPPKVTIHPDPQTSVLGETPSQMLMRGGSGIVYKIDTSKRKIGVRKIDALQLYRLTKIMGPTSDNQTSLRIAMSACSVVEIDGEMETFPNSERMLEFRIQTLGMHGLAAVNEALEEIGNAEDDGVKAAKN